MWNPLAEWAPPAWQIPGTGYQIGDGDRDDLESPGNRRDYYCLGCGGGGSVWMGFKGERRYALKFVAQEGITLSGGEFCYSQDLRHQNIIPVLEIVDLSVFRQWRPVLQVLVMADGGLPLSRICEALGASGSSLPPLQLWKYLEGLVDALRYLHHQEGLVHRDITPDNVLIETRGFFGTGSSLRNSVARLGDLGTLIPTGAEPPSVELKQDRFASKAPELFSDSVPDRRRWSSQSSQDIYALGRCLGYALQHCPTRFQNQEEALVRFSLEKLQAKCMQPDPADRPTAEVLYRELLNGEHRTLWTLANDTVGGRRLFSPALDDTAAGRNRERQSGLSPELSAASRSGDPAFLDALLPGLSSWTPSPEIQGSGQTGLADIGSEPWPTETRASKTPASEPSAPETLALRCQHQATVCGSGGRRPTQVAAEKSSDYSASLEQAVYPNDDVGLNWPYEQVGQTPPPANPCGDGTDDPFQTLVDLPQQLRGQPQSSSFNLQGPLAGQTSGSNDSALALTLSKRALQRQRKQPARAKRSTRGKSSRGGVSSGKTQKTQQSPASQDPAARLQQTARTRLGLRRPRASSGPSAGGRRSVLWGWLGVGLPIALLPLVVLSILRKPTEEDFKRADIAEQIASFGNSADPVQAVDRLVRQYRERAAHQLAEAVRSPNRKIRNCVLMALMELDDRAEPATAELGEVLREPGPATREDLRRVILILAHLRCSDQRTADALVTVAQAEDQELAELALQALARIGTPAAIDQLRGVLSKPAEKLSFQVVSAITHPAADPEVRAFGWDWCKVQLNEGPPQAALLAAVGLRGFGQQAAPLLIEAVHRPELDGRVRLAAVRSLEKLGPAAAPAVPSLLHMIGEGPELARRVAGSTLVAIGSRAVPGLVTLLNHRSWVVRAHAADLLGQLGSAAHKALPALRRSLRRSHEFEEVRRRTAWACRQIQKAPKS